MSEQVAGVEHRTVGHGGRGTAARADHRDRAVAVGRRADRQRTRDGERIADRPHLAVPVEHRVGDRRAAGRLRRVYARGSTVDQPGRSQLRRGRRGPREQRARTDRHDDVIGQAPPELFGALEEKRLRTLGVVGPQREVHEPPALLVGETRAQAIHLVVGAAHSDHGRAVRGGARDLALVGRRGNEDERAKPVARGGRGHRAREVSGRRARERIETELERAREGERHRTVLERQRGIARVVLQEQPIDADGVTQAVRTQERRPAHRVMRGRLGDREEIRVAPQGGRTGLDSRAELFGLEQREVVLGLDGPVALGAHEAFVGRLQRPAGAAAKAAKSSGAVERRGHRYLQRNRKASLFGRPSPGLVWRESGAASPPNAMRAPASGRSASAG